MLTTLELRCFIPGTPSTEVRDWFTEDCPGKPLGLPEEREDLYLCVPECDYLNIKLRQGSLEVKWRKAQLGVVKLDSKGEGNVEKWLKWICADPDQQSMIPANVDSEAVWIRVKKTRSQRLYQGITYELTQLRVSNDSWWSLAFEMAIEEANQDERFQQIVHEVCQTYPGMGLECDRSFAYPSWLAGLTTDIFKSTD